ncbi:MAG: hypothetical protein HeimC3_51340 [Candidatus Heimdallarchaeota archaeon LC_3]|nr:MAG: hypothetical protein HeimC3_51340 [Candidatus Heimdallarchaeota archaeon LC_3]
MAKNLNIRLDDDLLTDLDLISKWDEIDRTSVIRQLLRRAITLKKLDYGVRLYQEGKASIGKTAEIAGVSLWELHDHLRNLGIQHSSDEIDLQNDIEIIRKKHNIKI